MKVTFIQDHQSVLSGHSFYAAGTKADLVKGAQLVEMGIAYEGWTKLAPVVVETAVIEPKPEPIKTVKTKRSKRKVS